MRYSDIKVGCIYSIIFDPVRKCEFDRRHLGVVLKRNNDHNTFVVMPLTSAPNGEGVNKVKLGKLSCLPQSLKKRDSYAVYNQVRTLNADRFVSLKEQGNVFEAQLDGKTLQMLLTLAIQDISFNLFVKDKISMYRSLYINEMKNRVTDLNYKITKSKNNPLNDQDEIRKMTEELADLLKTLGGLQSL